MEDQGVYVTKENWMSDIKIEMLLDSIIDTCKKTTSGNVAYQIVMIKHHAELAKEKLEAMKDEYSYSLIKNSTQLEDYAGIDVFEKQVAITTKGETNVYLNDY